jgi:hypothetical protein
METAGITPQLRLAILARLTSRQPTSADGSADVVEGRLLTVGNEDAATSGAATRSVDSSKLELLGAFLEGRLATDERAEALRWLADDPDCYAAYLDLAQIADGSRSIEGTD